MHSAWDLSELVNFSGEAVFATFSEVPQAVTLCKHKAAHNCLVRKDQEVLVIAAMACHLQHMQAGSQLRNS